jgi:hypothetical protein
MRATPTLTERDAKLYERAFGQAVDLEGLTREFDRHKARTEAKLEAIEEKLQLLRGDVNAIGGIARGASRNGQVRIAVLGGGGAALFEIANYFLTHLR